MSNEYKEFENIEDLWFWFCRSIEAREEGFRNRFDDYVGYVRRCEICDIERIIKRLKLAGLITNRHLRVMARWGRAQLSPFYNPGAKNSEIRLWEEGLSALYLVLKEKGILQ